MWHLVFSYVEIKKMVRNSNMSLLVNQQLAGDRVWPLVKKRGWPWSQYPSTVTPPQLNVLVWMAIIY